MLLSSFSTAPPIFPSVCPTTATTSVVPDSHTSAASTEADVSKPAGAQLTDSEAASMEENDYATRPYLPGEKVNMVLSKQRALDALVNMERRQASHPQLGSARLVPQAASVSAPDSDSILDFIQKLEAKLEAMEHLATTNRHDIDRNRQDINRNRQDIERIHGDEDPKTALALPWIVDIQRFKKLNLRSGSAQLYDDSESVEEIRARETSARGGGYVLKLCREYDWEGNALITKLEICSTPLLELIRDVIKYYPGPEYDLLRWEESAADSVIFSEPYMMFFTYRPELTRCLTQPDLSDEKKAHLRLLLNFLREELPRTSAKLDELEAGTCKKISFPDVWLLYTPNTPVYQIMDGMDHQMVVYSRGAPEKKVKGQWGVLNLYCWATEYQGKTLTRIFSQQIIQPFVGEKLIQNLDLVPMQYLPDHDDVRARLIARGHRYVELNQAAELQDYHGDVFPRVFKDEPIRVVVDQATYWQRQGADSQSRHDDTSEEYGFPDGEEALVDEHGAALERALVCCYPRVGVFSLRDKDWASVRVDDLQPVRFRDKAFKRLVIKEEYKRMMIAMVEAYMLAQPGFSDLVTGKGRGLIILLHGPPGVGKTLTAECIAERERRPLYWVSCGDLGTEPVTLEHRLKEVFSYAVQWKAILLMDEADIFLQERDTQEVSRNALVSIFLRELEYFDGILFLTTNRPGDIDEAFQSRIHVSIGLKALNLDEQRLVWAVFIRDLALSDRDKRTLLEHVTTNFQRDRLNGRQIRNAIRTSLALAQLKKEKLGTEHLDSVINLGREFSEYMEDLKKMNSEDYPIALGRRGPTK